MVPVVGEPDRARVVSGLELRVLGPVEVVWDGRVVDIGGPKARAFLARLLIDRGLVVPVDRVVDSLWVGHDGVGAEVALRSTVSRLRKRLRDAGAPDVIVTRAPGYALDVPADATDVLQFEHLVAEGRRELARRRPREASRLLSEAEALWRGGAYSEVHDEPFARAEARRLEEQRLSATETRIDAGLTLGQHHALAAELETLTNAHPLRERMWSQRMLALYRSGRQAEALRVFQDLRSSLVAELGIEPGHEVTWLEHAILAHDAALDFPVPPEAGDARSEERVPSAGWGSRVPVFEGALVGRASECALLDRWWSSVPDGGGRLLLIDGDPGIGKSRLAEDFSGRAAARGALVLWGRCDEEPVAPYQPFAEALGRYFHSLSADVISHMSEWQLTELSRLVPRLQEHSPVPSEERGDPENDRFRFFEALTAALNELGTDHDVLLVIDNLHWADQPTLLLLRHVLRGTDGSRLGIVAMYTDAEVLSEHRLRPVLADIRASRAVESIHLQGLSPAAVEELAQAWPEVPSEVVPQLYKLTDGNPLFLDELLRQLQSRADEHHDEDDATPVLPDLSPPEAIRELVARRVSRLPEDVIHLLQVAAVGGLMFDAAIVAEAAGLSPEGRLDAFDRAEESRLLRRVGADTKGRYGFSHALVREAIYGELLRGRRVRFHHAIALAMERAYAGALDRYVNEVALHFFMGAPLGDADKALRYSVAAGERALRLLAFEETVGHFTRALEICELYTPEDAPTRCDLLMGLAEAQNRAGDSTEANVTVSRAADLARAMGDAERLAGVALRAGPLSYLGIVAANRDHLRLLEEARAALPDEDTSLRAMVTARLGLVTIYSYGIRKPGVLEHSLALNSEAVAIARRLGDRRALGYALNARMHALWGIGPAPERLATGTELGEIAEEIGDELLALHGHMWCIRELLAQGHVEAVHAEITRFRARDTGPVHPVEAAYAYNLAAMMAALAGDFDEAESLGRQGVEAAGAHNELALSFYGALMAWTWWARGDLTSQDSTFSAIVAQASVDYPMVRATLALIHAETGEREQALEDLRLLTEIGWDEVADDQSEGVSIAMAAAACGVLGSETREIAASIYEQMRPYAGTAVVIRAPAAACIGPADQYLGLAARAMGDLALSEVHFEAALRLARRMSSPPFIAAAEIQLARTIRQRRGPGDVRVAILLRSGEEAALAMGLHRLATMAAEPG